MTIIRLTLLPAVLLSAFVFSTPAAAASFYVQSWGSDTNPCNKQAPCRSINQALGLASARDRVLVGPGQYDGTLNLNQEGLKLLSLNGARATYITGGLGEVIRIAADKVVVGQRRKGFTIVGDDDAENGIEGVTGVFGIRIEGNIITSGSTNADRGIDVFDGDRGIYRYNRIFGFPNGINVDAQTVPGADNQVVGNHIVGPDSSGDVCLFVGTGEGGVSQVRSNVMTNCGAEGLYASAASPDKTSFKIIGNVVDTATYGGILLDEATSVVQKNVIRQSENGLLVLRTEKSNISNNLILASTEHAIRFEEGSGNTIKGNTTVIAQSAVHFFDPVNSAGTIQKNNFIGNTSCAVTIRTDPGTWPDDGPIDFRRNFWARLFLGLDSGPNVSCDAPAESAANAIYLTFDQVLKPNPVKYRGGL